MQCEGCGTIWMPGRLSCQACGWQRPAVAMESASAPTQEANDAWPVAPPSSGPSTAMDYPAKNGPGEPENQAAQKPQIVEKASSTSPPAVPQHRSDFFTRRVTAGRQKKMEQKDAEASVNVRDSSQIGQLINIVAHGVSVGGAPATAKGPEGRTKKRSIQELTTELPRLEGQHPFTGPELDEWARKVRTERVLLIGCVDAAVARSAAQALVDRLRLQRGPARLLSFDDQGGSDLTVRAFIQIPVSSRSNESVVVVDAYHPHAQTFLDSLEPKGSWSAPDLRDRLSLRKLLLLVCRPSHVAAASRGAVDPLPSWTVPFLDYLLRPAFGERAEQLGERLKSQRASGRWSREEREFYRQVKSCLDEQRLEMVISAGGFPTGGTVDDLAMPADKPVHQAALYVASHFPGLSAADFGRVMRAVLGDETTTVVANVTQVAADGTSKAGEVQKEKALIELWTERADRILSECRIVSRLDPNVGRVLEFADAIRRTQVLQALQNDHSFYLHAKFNAISQKLFFDPSEVIAGYVAQLTAEMMATDTGTYTAHWLLALRQGPGGWSSVQIARLARVLRLLFAASATRGQAAAVLDMLIVEQTHDAIGGLLRSLMFAPNFDPLYWIKQVMDRGNEEARGYAYRFLCDEVVGRSEVYPLLQAIAEWLPPVDTEPERYPPSAKLALQFLLDYITYAIAEFEPADYGAWPSPYPLFATSDTATIRAEIDLVMRWMFHPGMHQVVADLGLAPALSHALAAIIAEWAFILYGPTLASIEAVLREGDPLPLALTRGPGAVVQHVLKQLLVYTHHPAGLRARIVVLAYWEALKRSLQSAQAGRTTAERAQLAWKQQVVRILMIQMVSLRD